MSSNYVLFKIDIEHDLYYLLPQDIKIKYNYIKMAIFITCSTCNVTYVFIKTSTF